MYRPISALFLAATLVGCASNAPEQKDWVEGEGCEKYFSETPRALADCKAYVKSKEESKKAAQDDVSLEKAGTKVSSDKDIKNDDVNRR